MDKKKILIAYNTTQATLAARMSDLFDRRDVKLEFARGYEQAMQGVQRPEYGVIHLPNHLEFLEAPNRRHFERLGIDPRDRDCCELLASFLVAEEARRNGLGIVVAEEKNSRSFARQYDLIGAVRINDPHNVDKHYHAVTEILERVRAA